MIDTSRIDTNSEVIFANIFSQRIHEMRPSLRFVNWHDALSHLDEAGLSREYEQKISTDDSTQADRTSLFSKIGSAVGVRYFLVVTISSDEFAEGHGVTADAELWDSRSANVIWRAVGQAFSRSTDITIAERNFKPYAEIVVRRIILGLLP